MEGIRCSAISPAGEDGEDKRGPRGETGEFGKTEKATWHRLRMGVNGFFVALDEVKIDGGVLRWTVFLSCSMRSQYDVEARMVLEGCGENGLNGGIETS